MRAEAFRCSDSSEARDEPLYGTASVVRSWLLLEQPGSWGYDALRQSRLPQQVARELRRRARAAGVRVVLIRRGVRLSTGRRQCYFARIEDSSVYLSHLSLETLDDLLDIDLAPLGAGQPITTASERREPLFLVCTHGRHDACCSIKGNEVSRIACAKPGVDAWECSHIGGDRFAANLVCFPQGIYYGRVRPGDVESLMEAYGRGTVLLDHYRGRCCYGFAVQAAEYFLRRKTGATGVDDLRLLHSSTTPGGGVATFALADGNRAEVEVRAAETNEPYRLTCGSTQASVFPRYELISCAL